MESSKKAQTQAHTGEKETNIGTILSVGIVGVVILLTYLLLFGIYMDRV